MSRYPADWLAANIKKPPALWSDEPNDSADLRELPIVATQIQPTRSPRYGAMRARQSLGVPAGYEPLREAPAIGCSIDYCAFGLARKEEVTA